MTAASSFALSGLAALGRPAVMGVLNVTPDSFSDGGRFFSPEAAVARAASMAAEGADILDIGAESTRPYGGAKPVSEENEIARLAPVLPDVVKAGPPVSIDTMKAAVARWALAQGAAIVNDVWGLQRDPDMARVVADHAATIVIMHNRDRSGDRLRQDAGAKPDGAGPARRIEALRAAAPGRRVAQAFHRQRHAGAA